ncbi:phosphoacetylglucosamine mutase-like [Liolophura sinensis]|uniref:phosphoacetylglucosamine mutase-like n=1 Tax=Liolophura sinensis TaxID=3198878 RepID=UPI0031596DFC
MESITDLAQKIAQEKHPRKVDKVIQYGTAGFRTRAENLDHVMYRMGLLAVLRSKERKATIGVMITASHNPEEDNGVKLIDPHGEMLEASWEVHATHIANVPDDGLAESLRTLIQKENIDMSVEGYIYVAKDTRPSSSSLSQAVMDGVSALKTNAKDYGLLTTPQLHYMVTCKNTEGSYGTDTEEGYYQKLSSAFKLLHKNVSWTKYSPVTVVDAANGVGAVKLKEMQKYIGETLKITVYNDGSSGKLNLQCGADYVKVQQKGPIGCNADAGVKLVSFDGDADRIVFYFFDKDGKFHLLDGDKIATLVAGYLTNLVTQSGLKLKLGLVQTAYANGSSTKYIRQQLKIPVACVPTGVKHLHHKALEYDVGVYFEANGHGTVVFSDDAMNQVKKAASDESRPESERKGARNLSTVIDVINQTVGDAISDLLLVEIVLCVRDWSLEDWDKAYTDLPNRQLKVKVKDRTVIKTSDAERKADSPPGLQEAVDSLVEKYPSGRSFVRPSGTEDVVRVYAEAETQADADMLGYEVSVKVYELAGGVGDKPSPPAK